MIEKIEVKGTVVDEWTRKYALKRLRRVDKYIGKKSKGETTAHLTVTQVSKPYGNKYEMVAVVEVPGAEPFVAKEQVANMIAGVDIIEAKLIAQMRKAKTVAERKKKGLTHKVAKLFKRR